MPELCRHPISSRTSRWFQLIAVQLDAISPADPLLINNCFYWMLWSDSDDQDYKYSGRNDILEFDIISEDLRVLPCPVPLNTACMSHQTRLFDSSVGVLSFVLLLPNTITIWRLEDHVEQLWTSAKYTFSVNICPRDKIFSIIALVDGILSLSRTGRLFLCNLKEGSVKNYPKRQYSGDVSCFSHQMSLASLKNCKPALYINKDLEVLEGPIPDEIRHEADKGLVDTLLNNAGGEKNGCTSGLGNSSLQHSQSSRPQFSTPDVQILELTQQVSDPTNQNQLLNEKVQEMAARDAARDEEMAARDAARDKEMATFRAFMTRFGEDRETRGSAS